MTTTRNETEAIIPQMERQQQADDRARQLLLLLPDDVLAEVLRRLSPRGLATCRCVCTAWRAAIDGRGLLRADLLPPRSLAGLFLNYGGDCPFPFWGIFFSRPSSSTTSGSSYRLPYDHVQDHCNGLLLLPYRAAAVLNPATGRSAPLPECPPLPPGLEHFFRQMYLVFDPAAAAAAGFEVVAVPGPPCRDNDDEEEEEDRVRARVRGPLFRPRVRRVARSLQASEWPPSPFVLDVFSSATGRWEKRAFARDGEGTGTTLAEVQLDDRWWAPPRRSVYWRGDLYVHCENDFVMRISMSNNTYRIIKPPRKVTDSCRGICLHLGRSEGGVYSALYDDAGLQVWILFEESQGKMEWTLRHDSGPGLLQASLNCRRRQEHGPWILQGHYSCRDDYYHNRQPVQQHTLADGGEWNSDDDENVLGVGDRTDQFCCGYDLEILGFHPYKEIIFLHRGFRGFAYHLKTSKLEDLGDLYPPGSNANEIKSCVPYTPCLAGDLPEIYKVTSIYDEVYKNR